MKVTLHLEGNRQAVLDQIDEYRVVIAASLDAQPSAKAAKRKRAKKQEEIEDEANEPEEDNDEMEVSDDDEEDETDTDEAEETEDEEDDSSPTLKQVTNALKKFAARGEKYKDKAMAILKKHKVKHVDDLPKKVFGEVLKQLK